MARTSHVTLDTNPVISSALNCSLLFLLQIINYSLAKNYANTTTLCIFKYDRKYSIVHNQNACISIAGQESTQCLVCQVVLLLLGKYLIIVVIKWKTKKYHSMGTIQKSNMKIVERCKINAPNT